MTMLADLFRDFRYAARVLARTPGFTVAVLALGIGATSSIFSLVSAVWLKPLPFADAERIVTLWVDPTALGAPPRVTPPPAGRTFAADDAESEPVVISESFWLRRLNGDPAADGRTITLDGSPHLVVGVVPRDFRFPNGAALAAFVPARRAARIDPMTALRAEG
jgi:putative ABC transport system permease protein